ncbi:MAG: UDP-N-acetylmuramoyl-L-alanyl-D-glutamate--2,6-diaminopimelate ligase [Clostridia bacterium]
MTISNLIKSLEQNVNIDEFEVSDIVYDSRQAVENCVFVCLTGSASNGHNYVNMAVEKGAKLIVAQEKVEATVPVIMVENTKKALAVLSCEFFGRPQEKLKTIGITGTKGKTTTACMVKSILESAGQKVGMIGTLGFVIAESVMLTDNTTPQSYLVYKFMAQMVKEGCSSVVMEVSSIGLKDYRVYGFDFDCAVFTNFSEDHIGGVEHKDMKEYLECKAMLFKMCKIGCVNIDDENIAGILKDNTCEVASFGFNGKGDLVGFNPTLLSKADFIGCSFEVSGLENYNVEVGIPGNFNAYNALSAISACHVLGISKEAILHGLEIVKVKGRVEPVAMKGNFTLLLDYAHNAVSMENILSTLRQYNPKRLICVFGAGGNRPKVRRYEMGEVCGNMADLSVITADNSRFEEVLDIIEDIKIGMHKTNGKYIEIPDRRKAIRYVIENAMDGDIIVLAGKGHEDYQEIKGVKYPFDERVVIKEILEDM